MTTEPKPNRKWPWRTLVVWAVVAATFYSIWPAQPRLVISDLGSHVPVGFFGNTNLVTFTSQIAVIDGPGSRLGLDFPMHIWDLQTGTRREIAIPREKPQHLDGHCHWFPNHALIRGHWMQVMMDGVDDDGKIQGPAIVTERQTAFVNLETGQSHVFNLNSGSRLELSSTGRWIAECSDISDSQQKLRVIDTATREERLSAIGLLLLGQFSADDSLFACSICDSSPNTTKIWDLRTGEIVQTVDGFASTVKFSTSNRYVAATFSGNGDQDSKYLLKAWEIGSPDVATFREPGGFSGEFLWPVGDMQLDFTDDDQWLLIYEQTKTQFLDLNASPDRSRLRYAWRPASGEVSTYDLNPSELLGCFVTGLPAAPPEFAIGRTIYSVPGHVLVSASSSDGRTVVYLKEKPTAWGRLVATLQQRGISLPATLQSIPTSSAIATIVDLTSDQHLGTIPVRSPPLQFQGDFWFTPDGKSLLMQSPDSSDIGVWDLPIIHRHDKRPLACSLVVPAISLLWSGWRRWRTRTRATV